LPEDLQRIPKTVLGHGPLERHALTGHQCDQPLVPLNGRKQSAIVAEFISLQVERVRLSSEVADPIVLVSAPLGKHGGGIGEVHRGLSVPQSSKCDFAAPGGSIGCVDSEAVESTPLLRLDIREQRISFG
jgi:hypothetical protein